MSRVQVPYTILFCSSHIPSRAFGEAAIILAVVFPPSRNWGVEFDDRVVVHDGDAFGFDVEDDGECVDGDVVLCDESFETFRNGGTLAHGFVDDQLRGNDNECVGNGLDLGDVLGVLFSAMQHILELLLGDFPDHKVHAEFAVGVGVQELGCFDLVGVFGSADLHGFHEKGYRNYRGRVLCEYFGAYESAADVGRENDIGGARLVRRVDADVAEGGFELDVLGVVGFLCDFAGVPVEEGSAHDAPHVFASADAVDGGQTGEIGAEFGVGFHCGDGEDDGRVAAVALLGDFVACKTCGGVANGAGAGVEDIADAFVEWAPAHDFRGDHWGWGWGRNSSSTIYFGWFFAVGTVHLVGYDIVAVVAF